MSNVTDFIADFESLGKAPEGAVVDLAITVFDHDPHKVPVFADLVKNSIRFKFDLASQKGRRVFDADTIEWWKQQSAEARKNLTPSAEDVDFTKIYDQMMDFLKEKGFNKRYGQGWCRGQSFDFPIMVDIIRQTFKTRDTFSLEPCFFWQQRDVRTAIEATLMTRNVTTCPLPKGSLDGFVHHDSVHDNAKAVMELIYSKRYALGLEDVPTGDNVDPLSIRK